MWTREYGSRGKVTWVKKKAPPDVGTKENVRALTPQRAKTILRTLEEKKAWFEAQCNAMRISYTEDSITLVVEREHILRDSLEQFRTTDDFDLHKEIKIFYVGEVA